MENKKIDYRFKILYAVGMLMVVGSHTGGAGISLFADWFPYKGQHIALFVFCSGYFYKKASESNVGRYIIKKVKTLLVPFFIYNVVYGLIVQALRSAGFTIGGDFTLYNLFVAPFVDGHQFDYNLGGWFVVPLFTVEVLNVLIRAVHKRVRVPEWLFFAVFTALGVAGNLLACKGYIEGAWVALARVCFFLPFFELGIFYKNVLEKYDKKIPTLWYFVFIFAAKLIIARCFGRMPVYTPSWCNDFTDGPLMPVIIGALGIAFWLRVAAIVQPVIGKNKYVNLVADNTYSIMMNQFAGFMLLKALFGAIGSFTPLFADFNWVSFKSHIFWYYVPGGMSQMMILYAAAGIVFPILVQKAIDKVKGFTKLRRSKADK